MRLVNMCLTMLASAIMLCCCIPITTSFLIFPSSSIHRQHHHSTYYDPDHRTQHQQTAVSSTKSHQADHDWSINAIEEARQQFEHLIGPMLFDDSDSMNENSKIILSADEKKPHLLTNAARKRRDIEVRLLESLQYSDDAIDELMTLWIHECPNQIVNIDILQFMSSKDSSCTVKEAEMILRNVIHDCPITVWSEPGARLAYILFLQEEYDECERYVQSVLSVKPWHFEMIQLQILLELTYHHNLSRAIRVARHYGLPPLHHSKQRSRWVANAKQQAQHQLQQLEWYTATERHGGPIPESDRHHSNSTSSSSSLKAATSTSSSISSWQ